MKSWEKIQDELKELQRKLSGEPLVIEITFKDGETETKQRFTIQELINQDLARRDNWIKWRVYRGTNLKDVKLFLDWLADDVI